MGKSKDEFYQILEQHKLIIYKICNSYCKNEEDRKDLSQEIILQIWRSLDRFNPKFKMSTWIYRIALNVAISFYRKSKTEKAEHELPAEDVLEGFDDIKLTNPLIEQLYDFINDFDSLNKALIILYLDDYDHVSIANILGLSVSNVGTKISRIKKALKERFDAVEAN